MANTNSLLTKKIEIGPAIDELELDREAAREFWILLLLRGISMLAFGFTAVIWPAITLVTLAYIFSVYILFVGALDIVNGFRLLSSKSPWFLKVLLGIVEVGIGLYLLRSGFVVTTVIFLQSIGLILILQACIESVVAIRAQVTKGLKFLMLFSALLSFIIGVSLLRFPVTVGVTYAWLIGLYGIVGGAMTVAAAFSVRPSKA